MSDPAIDNAPTKKNIIDILKTALFIFIFILLVVGTMKLVEVSASNL